jgi:hypothetical protein
MADGSEAADGEPEDHRARDDERVEPGSAPTHLPEGVDEDDFSVQLERWLRGDGPKTLGGLGEVFAEKAYAVTILLLMFLPALPLPTGGISHVFEAITVFVALQLVIGRRTPWLPARWRERELGPSTTEKGLPFMIRRIRWFERFSTPRLTLLFTNRIPLALIGVLLVGLAAGAALSPPFSGLDTLPALGAVVVALSIILEDALLLVIGLAIGTGGIAISLTLGAAVVQVLKRIF